jgi:hypothetical protein
LLRELIATYSATQLQLTCSRDNDRVVTAYARHGPIEALHMVLEAGASRDAAVSAVVGPYCNLPVPQRLNLVMDLMGLKCDITPGHSSQLPAQKCDLSAATLDHMLKLEQPGGSSRSSVDLPGVTPAEVTHVPEAVQQKVLELLPEAVRGGVPQIVTLLLSQVDIKVGTSKAFHEALKEGRSSIVRALLSGPWQVVTSANAVLLLELAVALAADVDPSTDTAPPTNSGSFGASHLASSLQQQQQQEGDQGVTGTGGVAGAGGGVVQEADDIAFTASTACTSVDRLGVLHLMLHAAARALHGASSEQPQLGVNPSEVTATAAISSVTCDSEKDGTSTVASEEVSSAEAGASAKPGVETKTSVVSAVTSQLVASAQAASSLSDTLGHVKNAALVIAAGAGAVAAVKYLVKLGADPLFDWEASIRAAAENSRTDVIQELLNHG